MRQQPRLLFGTSAAITKVLDQCARYARTRDPIVLLGQRGTGKTALAEHIHELSRRPGEFVEESAAGLQKDMEIDRLTGHIKGAFTDAREDRPGLLETANGGTLFLDEMQLASAQLQGVLLRLVEKSRFRRQGDVRERPVDVRLIVASNEELGELVAQDRFRADLLDRFGCMIVRLPPLADRRGIGVAATIVGTVFGSGKLAREGVGAASRLVKHVPLPVLDRTGKLHGQLPTHIPGGWSTEQLEDLAGDLRTSVSNRKLEQARLGEHGPHRERIRQEEQLLRQVEKRLGGS